MAKYCASVFSSSAGYPISPAPKLRESSLMPIPCSLSLMMRWYPRSMSVWNRLPTAYTRTWAPEAMPLDQETSRVSSPVGAGSTASLTLISVMLSKLCGILVFAQNVSRSDSNGTVSMRMAMVCPVPSSVAPSAPVMPAALYAAKMSDGT